MALVLGTNCGFVTVAPTSDPDDGNITIDDKAFAQKHTTPVGITRVTEIGWWCNTATPDVNFEAGIYDHDSGVDEPDLVVGSISTTNAKGTTLGWKRVTGLNIPVDTETEYWIAIQLDNTTSTGTNRGFDSIKYAIKNSATSLPSPWDGDADSNFGPIALYAVVEGAAPAGTNMKINIGDSFKDVDALKINIGDVFKDVVAVKLNISDVWKDVF